MKCIRFAHRMRCVMNMGKVAHSIVNMTHNFPRLPFVNWFTSIFIWIYFIKKFIAQFIQHKSSVGVQVFVKMRIEKRRLQTKFNFKCRSSQIFCHILHKKFHKIFISLQLLSKRRSYVRFLYRFKHNEYCGLLLLVNVGNFDKFIANF